MWNIAYCGGKAVGTSTLRWARGKQRPLWKDPKALLRSLQVCKIPKRAGQGHQRSHSRREIKKEERGEGAGGTTKWGRESQRKLPGSEECNRQRFIQAHDHTVLLQASSLKTTEVHSFSPGLAFLALSCLTPKHVMCTSLKSCCPLKPKWLRGLTYVQTWSNW